MMTLSRLNIGDMESEEDPLHHGAAQQEEPEADGGHHPDSVMHTCNVCDKQFKKKSLLTKHVKIHAEGKFVCDTCGKRFKSSWNRNFHQKQVHSSVRFPCDTCGKSYKMESSLRTHMTKKHGVNSAEEMSTPRSLLESTTLTCNKSEFNRKFSGPLFFIYNNTKLLFCCHQ